MHNRKLIIFTLFCFNNLFCASPTKPVADDISPPAFNEDTESIITLSYSDPQNDLAMACSTKSLNSVTETTACSCNGSGGCTIGVTGFSEYSGSASFQYNVVAGGEQSNWAIASLTINNVNDTPVISAIANTSTNEDTDKDVTFTVSDADDILSCSSSYLSMTSSNTSIIQNSSVIWSGTAPNCTATITPESNANGASTITITVDDGNTTSNAQFVLTVNPVADAPVVSDFSPSDFDKDTESDFITLDYTDADNDEATDCNLQNLTNVTETTDCACSSGTCTVKVTGTTAYSGAASFEFNVTANGQTSNQGTASFTIIETDIAPTISDITDKSMNENDSIDIDFTISAAGCSSGSLSMNSSNTTVVPNTNVVWSGTTPDCTATITPASNQYGTPTITITVTNPTDSDNDSFVLTVNEVDDPPASEDISPASFNEDSQSIITLVYTDPESDAATSCSVTGETNITETQACSCSSGTCTVGVTGTSNYYGSAGFTYTVTANGLESNSSTATLTIDNVNDAPTISDITDKITNEDTSVDINFTISDIDNTLACSSLYVSMTSSNTTVLPNSHIILSGTAPNCIATITPSKDEYGSVATVTLIVDDGTDTDSATFSLTVNSVDDAPEAYDIYPPMMSMNTEEIFILSYSDPENDLATGCSVTGESNVTETTACSCDGSGICTVGVTGTLDFTGEGNFDFDVTANGKTSNSATTATLLIDVTFPDGILDTNFDSDGYFIHNSLAGGDEDDYGNAAVMHNDNIYIVGSSFNATAQGLNMAVWNVSSTGSLVGWTNHNSAAGGGWNDEATAIVRRLEFPKYYFYIFGTSFNSSGDRDIAIWKLKEATGTLDTTFGGDGAITYDGAAGETNSNEYLNDAIIVDDDTLIAVGASENSSGYYDMYIMRADEDGNLDYSFGGNGFVTVTTPSNDEFAYKLAITSNGKYIVAGESWDSGDQKNLKVWRFNSNGTLDTTFASGGVFERTASGSDFYSVRGLHVDYDDYITVAGGRWDNTGGVSRGYVIRLDDTGALDTGFSDDFDGYWESGPGDDESYNSVIVQADGYIMVGGYEWVYDDPVWETNLKVCRLTPAGALDATFGTGGCETHDSAAGGSDWDIVNYLLLSSDHFSYIYAIGASYNSDSNYDMAIWAFK